MNSVDIGMDTRRANVGAQEILKVVDLPFDGTGQKPEIVLTLHATEGIDDRLSGLGPHENGYARIFCVPQPSLYKELSRYLVDKYSLPGQWCQHFSKRFTPALASSDISNASLQWTQHATDDSLPPQRVATITDKKLLNEAVVGIESSQLICLNCDENKLLAITYTDWETVVGPGRLPLIYSWPDSDRGAWIDTIMSRKPLHRFGDGDREQFTKLLLLDFFSFNYYLGSEPIHNFLHSPLSDSNLEQRAISVGSGFTTGMTQDYIDILAQHETVLEELHQVGQAIDFISGLVLPLGHNTENGGRELIIVLQQHCHQRLDQTRRSIARINRAFDAKDKLHNMHESLSVRRLTILATIFLPLSLSSSILSMQTRFVDLKLRLYDFIGVFVIVGTGAVVLLMVVRVTSKVRSGRFGSAFSPAKLWARSKAFNTAEDPGLVGLKTNLRLYAILFGGFCAVMWMIVLMSFIIGMVKDVVFGLKLLGYGCGGLFGFVNLGAGLLFIHSLRAKRHLYKTSPAEATDNS